MGRPRAPEPRRRRERGDDGISWDRANKCYVGTISLGYDDAGKRLRRTARGKTKQAVKDKLDKLHEEIKAGIETPATYTASGSASRTGSTRSNLIRTPWPPIEARPRSGSTRR